MKANKDQRIAINTILLGIRMVIVLAITLFTTRILLKALGIEDYGINNVVSGFVAMCSFVNTSMANGIQRFFNVEYYENGDEGAKKVFNTGLVIQLIIILLIFIVCEPLGQWYVNHKLVVSPARLVASRWIFQCSLVSLAISMLEVPFAAAIMAHEKMGYYAVLNILDAVLKLGIAYIVKNSVSDRLILYGTLLVSISVINLLAGFVYCKFNFKEIKFGKHFDFSLLKSMLSFSGWNLFGSFGNVFKEQGLNIILNRFFGPVVNAARGVAAQVSSGFHQLVASVTTASRPQIVQSYAENNVRRSLNIMMSISKLISLFLYAMVYPVFLELDYILNLWLDEVPQDTSTFIKIVVATMFINNLNSCVSGIVHASGKMKTYQLCGTAFSIVPVLIAYFACRMGASSFVPFVIVLVMTVVGHVVSLLVLRTIVDFSILNYCKEILLPLFLVIVTTFYFPLIPYLLMPQGFLRLVVVVVTAVVPILLFSYLLGLNRQERDLVLSFVKAIFPGKNTGDK